MSVVMRDVYRRLAVVCSLDSCPSLAHFARTGVVQPELMAEAESLVQRQDVFMHREWGCLERTQALVTANNLKRFRTWVRKELRRMGCGDDE